MDDEVDDEVNDLNRIWFQNGSSREHVYQQINSIQEMFEVVQHQQHFFVSEEIKQSSSEVFLLG